jgi:hypothetical protein
MSQSQATSLEPIQYLSQLLLAPSPSFTMPLADLPECLGLADKHHVIVRWVRELCRTEFGRSLGVAEGAQDALLAEQARIANALSFLEAICDGLNHRGCDATVIKSLDHWPDLGSDLDLYSNAPSRDIIRVMKERFKAKLAPRSWGDRLAGKWNFVIPGLPEAVEVHVGRLGQTGEHIAWVRGIPGRAVRVQRAQYAFRVAAPDDRLMISTLQRMYRHFYFRLCDIVDTAQLIGRDDVNFSRLHCNAEPAGIWKGVASYLVIVSDYVKAYSGMGLALPEAVRAASRFSGEHLSFRRGFLRIPIVPNSVALYTSELGTLASKGELEETFRLSLLPGLAVAAAFGEKLTGSDKGIW